MHRINSIDSATIVINKLWAVGKEFSSFFEKSSTLIQMQTSVEASATNSLPMLSSFITIIKETLLSWDVLTTKLPSTFFCKLLAMLEIISPIASIPHPRLKS